MAGPSKLNGALRWSAAEEVAVRISAVRSQVAAAASGEGEMNKQLRNGLTEIDSIRRFIHDGINMCNRQYLDAGTRDAVLQSALERGLSELEDVRGKLVTTLSHSQGGFHKAGGAPTADGAAPPPPASSAVKRPPSAPVRTSVQREIEAKRQQRATNEQQRKSFLERMAGSTSASHPAEQNQTSTGGAPFANGGSSRPTSATQRAPLHTPHSGGGLKSRPTSATVRKNPGDHRSNDEELRPTASSWNQPDPVPHPTPPEKRGGVATPSNAPTAGGAAPTSGMKFRPSSAPNQRSRQASVDATAAAAAAQAAFRSNGINSNMESDTSNVPGGATASAWGKYQDWAQSVLSRVQSRRVMQHRQAMQRQREERTDAPGSMPPTPTTPLSASSTVPSSSQQQPPLAKTASNLSSQNVVQGNLRRPRPSTAGLTPAGIANTSGTTAAGANRPQSAKLNPQAQMFREQGNVLFQQKKYRESAESYSRAIECDPHSETLYCNRAAASLMLGRYHDALQDSLKAIEFDPTHVKAHWRAAKSYLYLGLSDDAKSMYLQAHRLASIQTESDAIDAEMKAVEWADKCKRCLKAREWQDALRLAEQVLDVFPPSGPCSMPWQCLRVEALIHVDAHEACNLLSQMTTDEPSSAEAWYLRAKALFYTGHDGVSTNSCLGYLQKSRELDPSNRSATLQLCIETFAKLRDEGNSAYSAGRWQEAHSAYTRCLTVDAYNTSLKAIILCNRAAVSIQCEKWKDALDDINQSIAFNPHNAKAYTRRARIYQHNGQFDLAVKDLQLAVQMYPSAENQERLTQAVEMKNQSTRQQAQKQQQQQQQQQGAGGGGSGGSFRYFGFASGGSASGTFANGQRPSTAGTRRPQSAGYGGESNNNAYNNYFNAAGGQSSSHHQQAAAVVQQRAKTCYEILCISRTSDEKGIVRAYRDAALKWHPDKWASATTEQKANAESVFKEISVAYNTLKDPQKRRQYDLSTS